MHDARRPRNDRQLLRQFLEAEGSARPHSYRPDVRPGGAHCSQGPPHVRDRLGPFADCSPSVLTSASCNMRWQSLRIRPCVVPPCKRSYPQTVQYGNPYTLSRDHGSSVSDCMNEIAYCRQDIPSALQPRPRAAQVSHIPVVEDPADPPPAHPAKRRRKARAAAKDNAPTRLDPKKKPALNPAAQAFDPSWFKQINGVDTCMTAAF